MLVPDTFVALAEDSNGPGRRRPGFIDCQLHCSRGCCRLFLVLLLEDERIVQLHVFNDHRSAALRKRCRCHHRSINRARRHNAAEHAVVAHPGRVGWEQFGFIGYFAARRFATHAKQGMACASASSRRSLQPVTPSLKRITRQGNPAPVLAREETGEPDRQPELVGGRDRFREFRAVRSSRRAVRGRPQAGQDSRRRSLGRLRPCRHGHGRQNRPRPDLDDLVHSQAVQRANAVHERDRLASVPLPVGAVQPLVRFEQPAGQVTDEIHGRRLDRQAVQHRFQVIQRRLHQGAVERP